MKVTVVEDATVLIPNMEHKNFTATKIVIPKGTEIEGKPKVIEGMRRGEPFKYRLFRTTKGELIFINKIKPKNMETTEVTLSAEGQKPATTISVPKDLVDRNALYGAVIGAVATFGYCAYKQKSAKEKLLWSATGAAIGFIAGKLFTKHKQITVKK